MGDRPGAGRVRQKYVGNTRKKSVRATRLSAAGSIATLILEYNEAKEGKRQKERKLSFHVVSAERRL